MDFLKLIDKYNIENKDEFKSDLFEFFLKSDEINSKKNEILNFFGELTKQIKEISENINKQSTKKIELGNFASKAAKEYASINNIDENVVEGTGQNGRITKSDLLKLTKKPKKTKKKKNEKKEIHTCKGIKSNGDSCDNNGVYELNGEWYCGFHKDQGTSTQSDELYYSSDEEDFCEKMCALDI